MTNRRWATGTSTPRGPASFPRACWVYSRRRLGRWRRRPWLRQVRRRRRGSTSRKSYAACGAWAEGEVGALVGAPVLEYRTLGDRLPCQVHPCRSLRIPADGDKLGAAVEPEPTTDDASVLRRGFGRVGRNHRL